MVYVIGNKVSKISRKPFKSGEKINTVKGFIANPHTGKPSLLFEEDDSVVEERICCVAPEEVLVLQ